MSRITEQLYLGSAVEASSKEWLKKHHVSHIINAAEEVNNYFPNDYAYLNLNLKDDMTQSLYASLERTYQFIYKALSNGGTVFVHCYAGISRSASVVIYFLMKLKGWTYIQSYKYVKERRYQVDPNKNFARQLVSVSPQSRYVFPRDTRPTRTPMRNNSEGGNCNSCASIRYGITPQPRSQPPRQTKTQFGPETNLRLKKPTGYTYNSVNSLGPGHSLEGLYQGL